MFAKRVLIGPVVRLHGRPLELLISGGIEFDRNGPLQSPPLASHLIGMRETQDGLTARMLGWLRRTVVNLSEKSVDEALDDAHDSGVDFDILLDPSHPKFPEMQRRYHQLEAREDSTDRE